MSKVLKTVAIVAVAVAVVVFAPQIAGIIAAAGKAVGLTIATTALTSTFVGMGLSLALAATYSAFRKTPNMSQSLADRLSTSVIPSAPRKIVFGTTAAGQDVRFFEGDIDLPSTKKDGYVQVIALASHRISAFRQFYVENDLVWQNGSWMAKRNGFAPNNPLRIVTEGNPNNGFAVGTGRYWRSNSTFTGCAYYAPFWKLDEKVWESGIPQRLTAIVDGCPVYDPRRDSSRGGVGAHRYGEQNTYAFRDGAVEIGRNPALALLTYLLGWRVNGKLMWGIGVPAHRIDFDNFRTYANLCEERVATQSGGTVQRYTADAIYSTTDAHETAISGLTAAMGSCKLTDRGGTYCLVGGYDDTAGPKVDFTADDLVAPAGSSSPYVWNPAPASRERYNIVRGRFANPEELYQLADWGEPIEIEPLADGVPRVLSLDLGAVSRAETCQRIAKQFLLREALTPGTFSALFGPKAFAAEVGSVVTLSLPAEGWNRKLFRVIDQAETHDLFFQMTLREEDPKIYAWDREEKPLPEVVRPQGYDPSTTISPENLGLTSTTVEGANGVAISEVHVSWKPEESGRVSSIQISSRPHGTEGWSEQAGAFDPTNGRFTFMSNVPGVMLEVRARFRMSNGVYSPWTIANVASAPVELIDNTARDRVDQVEEKVDEAIDELGEQVDQTRKQMPDLVTKMLVKPIDELSALNLTYGASIGKASKALADANLVAIRKLATRVEEDGTKVAEDLLQLTSRMDDTDETIEAGLSDIRRTITDNESATSEEIDTKIARYGRDVSAWQVEEQRVRAREDDALAESIDDMGVRVGDAEGKITEIERIIADDGSASAESVRELGVRLDTAEGAIRDVDKAVTDGDEALAESIRTISSTVDGVIGPQGRLATISGTIETLQQTQADDNGARAEEIKTLQTKFDGFNIASVEQKLTATTDKVDGLGAQYSLKLQINQNGQLVVAGGGIAIENGVSSIAWMADSFRIMTPGSTPQQVFYADAEGVYMPNVRVDTLTYGSLVDQFAGSRQQLDVSAGWQDIPGGLIMQFGQYRSSINNETSFSITFPKPFPNQCLTFVPVPYIAVSSTTRDLWLQILGQPTRFGASVFTQAARGDVPQRLDGFNWIAFGM